MSGDFGQLPSFTGRGNITLQAMQEIAKDTRQELMVEKMTAQEAFKTSLEEMVNPFAKRVRTQKKKRRVSLGSVSKMLKSGDKTERLHQLKQMERRAEDYEKRNPELKSKVLTTLRQQITSDMSQEEILKKVEDFYDDVSLADEAMEFLLETSEGELHEKVQQAKNNYSDTHGREITAGRNIGNIAREAKGIGTPTSLRDLYRDITGNPREPVTLFEELSQRYNYNELEKVIKFLFHSLGADLKAKGPSIPHGQLHRLIQETRALQAIQGVYRFFKGRMKLIQTLFSKEGLKVPERLTFEMLAKGFMSLAQERYPSADKALKMGGRLGLEQWLIAKIIVLSQMRDAVREVSMAQIYKSLQHRDELYMALIEALEDLEDELEEEEEEDEDWEEEEEDDGF